MIDINSFKQSFEDLANPAQTGDSFSPDQFNRELPIVLMSAIRRHLGLPEAYSPQMPQPAIAYEKTQMLTDELLEIKKTVPLQVNVAGFANIPDDFYYPSSMQYLQPLLKDSFQKGKQLSYDECCEQTPIEKPSDTYSKWKRIDILNDDEWSTMIGSDLRGPDATFPKCRFYDKSQLQFAPKNLFSVNFTYLRLPLTPKWNYTVDPNTLEPVYSVFGSTNIELPLSMQDTLRFMMLQRLGIPMREQELFQYGSILKKEGA